MPRNMQAWAGELVGTYGFVTIGAGAGIVAGSGLADLGLFGVAVANGVALAVMVTAFFAISGGHFNPAITLSALVGRRIRGVDALGYVACQVIGALFAGLTLRIIFEETSWRPAGLGAPGLTISPGRGVLVEAIFTLEKSTSETRGLDRYSPHYPTSRFAAFAAVGPESARGDRG